jgi:hypothetical protein
MMNASKRLYTLAEMQEFDVVRILELVRRLSLLDGFQFLNGRLAQRYPEKPEQPLDYSRINVDPFRATLHELGMFLSKAGLVVTKGYVDRIADLLKKPSFALSLATEYQKLHTTLRIEISQKHFFCMSESEKALFQPDKDHPIFGVVVQNNFPSALYEIDEAAKCLALDRSTATVFHLMRAMERTLFAIRRCLGLPDSTDPRDRSWGLILQSLRQEVERRNKQQGSNWGNLEDQHFFPDIIGSVAAVKLAWRDPTMHVERNYLPNEAQEVFAAVRTLMQKVASRMGEDGMPLA